MKIEIELDPNKIDYESINQQIKEKVAALDITADTSDIKNRIDSSIRNLIDDQVNLAYNEYYNQSYWNGGRTSEGKNLITSIYKEVITKKAEKSVNEILSEKNKDGELTNLLIELIPRCLTSVLFDKMCYLVNESVM